MPLIILGLLVVIGIIAYWFIGNQNSDKPVNPHDIEDKISSAVHSKAKDIKDDLTKRIRRRAGIYDIDYDVKDDGYGNSSDSEPITSNSKSKAQDADNNTIPFPEDAEREKRRRDIK